MTEKTYTIADMVGFAAGENAAEFQSAFNQVMTQNVADALDSVRGEVAQSFTNAEPEEVEVDDEVTGEIDDDAETV